MNAIQLPRRYALVLIATVGLAGFAPAGDVAIVRGQIDSIDAATRQVKVHTNSGADLTLAVDARTRLAIGGKAVPLEQFLPGQRVRATYEKTGGIDRLISMRTAVPTEADLSRDIREALRTARGYTAAQKDKYEDKMREVIDDVDDRIDDLQAQARNAAAEARPAIEGQIKNLKQKRDEFERRLDRAKPAAADAWEDLKTGVGAAADDLQNALDRFREEPKK
jgi:ElaB/YqjD/DUF883 family membrane-anchored ribosome-binding protein